MPINRNSKSLKGEEENNKTPIPIQLMVLIALLFFMNVSYETHSSFGKFQDVERSKSLNCLQEWTKTACSIINMSEKCESLAGCIQSAGGSFVELI